MLAPRLCSPLLLAIAAGILTSCSATVVTTQWQNPTTTQIRFTKVLSLCIAKDPYLRQAAEGELCRRMPRTKCKPAAYAIPDSMIADTARAKELTRQEGFDGAVVFRVLDAHEQVTYFPPTYGPTFWDYYGYAWPRAISPGYLRTDQVVIVETGIFSLARNELLWLGTTKTLNPKSLPDLVGDFAEAVRKELVARELIPAS